MKRGGTLLPIAVALCLLVLRLRPLPTGDPFLSTLAILPLAVAALLAVGRWTATHGGGTTPAAIRRAEAIAVGATVLLAVGRSHLGLGPDVTVDRLIAAGFALLLAHRLAWLVTALRPVLGERLPRRPPAVFLLLPLVAYGALLPWSAARHRPDGDEPYYLLLTHSLAFDHDADLTNNYRAGDSLRFMDRRIGLQPGDPHGPAGERYSRHNVLLPLLLALPYRLAGKMGALAVMALLAAALAWMTLRLAEAYFPARPGEALAVYALVAFTAPLLVYSYQVWVEVPAALLIAMALDQLRRLDETPRWPGRGAAIAAALVLLPLLKIRFAALALPLLLLGLLRGGRQARRRWLAFGAALVALVALILLYNQFVYGNPLKYHNLASLQLYVAGPLKYCRGILGLFFDCAFGLFAVSPLWLLLLPAALLLAARRHRLLADFAIVYLPYLLLLGPRAEWFGAWSPPFRYGLVLLPLLGIALVPLLAQRERGWATALLAALGGLTLVLTICWLVEPGWTYNLAHGRNHLLDHLATRLGADVGRFFPSSTRLRAATWIWPFLATALLAAAWWLPRRRPAARSAVRGTAALCLAATAVVVAAGRVPTHVIEFEDPYVVKAGGQLYPELWVLSRPKFRGAWALPAGGSVTAPVVAGGRRLHLSLDYRAPGYEAQPATLTIGAGDGPKLQRRLRRDSRWRTLDLDLEWKRGEPLVLELRSPVSMPRRTQILLNRARLRWSG